MPNVGVALNNFGASYRTVRRARAITTAASLCCQEEGFKRALTQSDGQELPIRVLKVGWDETALRMFCQLAQAQKLFPSMKFATEDDVSLQRAEVEGEEPPRKKRRKGQAQPNFRMQVMQQCAYASVGDMDVCAPLRTPQSIVKTTSADYLYSAATSFSHLETLQQGLGDEDTALASLHADSLEANKNVVTKVALENEKLLVVDNPCMG